MARMLRGGENTHHGDPLISGRSLRDAVVGLSRAGESTLRQTPASDSPLERAASARGARVVFGFSAVGTWAGSLVFGAGPRDGSRLASISVVSKPRYPPHSPSSGCGGETDVPCARPDDPTKTSRPSTCFVALSLLQSVILPCYMRPEGPWQQPCCCPKLASSVFPTWFCPSPIVVVSPPRPYSVPD